MMTIEEQKLAVCQKLPELIYIDGAQEAFWRQPTTNGTSRVTWATEGLQVCHEAEKLLSGEEFLRYGYLLNKATKSMLHITPVVMACATYEQRLEALCRIWFPEKWKD